MLRFVSKRLRSFNKVELETAPHSRRSSELVLLSDRRCQGPRRILDVSTFRPAVRSASVGRVLIESPSVAAEEYHDDHVVDRSGQGPKREGEQAEGNETDDTGEFDSIGA